MVYKKLHTSLDIGFYFENNKCTENESYPKYKNPQINNPEK